MLFSNNKLTRDELLSRFFPHYHPVASLSQSGLSGGSVIISDGDRRHVLRQPHDPSAAHLPFSPSVSRTPPTACQAGANPAVLLTLLDGGGVLRRGGESELPGSPQLSGLLYDLHQQPRFGWRVSLTPLLAQYWQRCDPARRKPRWAALASAAAPPGRSPVPCGWRRCTWTSMPAILFIMSPA
ncbi:thiamine kinase [Klebsiella pneumoniae]|uniref:Thiamine kinase n=1 Tax=Klebsiella pneumoniae TaxID=573 RepID=A0A2X1SGG8_KLEPN|nr:thiamine kinase [Klebsiella pneumoniae]